VAALSSFRANDPSLASADVLAMLAPQRRKLRGLNIDTAVYEQMIEQETNRLGEQTQEGDTGMERKRGDCTEQERLLILR